MTAPACWSWPVPALITDVPAEIARLIAENERRNKLLPRDERRTSAAFKYHLADPARYRFVEFHADRCAVCATPSTEAELVIDHDHQTGLVRGKLCVSCNLREGRGVSETHKAYRERNPATILRYWAYYVGFGWPSEWWRNPRRARALTGDPNWQHWQPIEGAAT